MPLTPGTKVKVKETFPHLENGNPGIPGHASDRLARGRVGTVTENDRSLDNVVKFEDSGDSGYFYDHELEEI